MQYNPIQVRLLVQLTLTCSKMCLPTSYILYRCLLILCRFEVSESLELVGMDLMSLTLIEDGNQYICVMADYFTKWAEACPLKSKAGVEMTKCILDFVYKFGAPQGLIRTQSLKKQVKI